MAILKINGVPMPDPSVLIPSIEPIVKAERNARGTMIKELIADKRKVELAWPYLTKDEAFLILNAVKPNFFQATYFDPEANAEITSTFYASPRKLSAIFYRDGVPYYKDLSFSIIER